MPRFKVQLCQYAPEFATIYVDADDIEDVDRLHILDELYAEADNLGVEWEATDEYQRGTHLVEHLPARELRKGDTTPVFAIRDFKVYRETVTCDQCGCRKEPYKDYKKDVIHWDAPPDILVADLVDHAENLGLDELADDLLDDIVMDVITNTGSDINNSGVEGQIRWLDGQGIEREQIMAIFKTWFREQAEAERQKLARSLKVDVDNASMQELREASRILTKAMADRVK